MGERPARDDIMQKRPRTIWYLLQVLRYYFASLQFFICTLGNSYPLTSDTPTARRAHRRGHAGTGDPRRPQQAFPRPNNQTDTYLGANAKRLSEET